MTPYSTQKIDSLWQRLTNAPMLRLILIGSVIILLQIPLFMIKMQIMDRAAERDFAIHEVTSRWGGQQTVLGPLLLIPYHEYIQHRDKNGNTTRETLKRYAGFLPEQINIDATTHHEKRQRGLFEIPLYQSHIRLSGQFLTPAFATWGIADDDVLWQEAQLLLLVEDAHAIQERAQLHWNKQVLVFQPGVHSELGHHEGYHVTLGLQAKQISSFNFELNLNGSHRLQFAPVGNDSVIHLQSDWPDPSFTGRWLPVKREVNTKGFNSEWRIAAISRGHDQHWLLFKENLLEKIQANVVGSDFLIGMDNYRLTERSTKYEIMFLLLTFLVIWLIEIVTQRRVHIIQYLLLGSALCLFYLLLVALGEHIGFYLAYILASLAIVLTASLYGKAILQSAKRGWLVGGIVTALYIYLFSLLNEQNYAFLIGSIGLFAALIATMYLTRHIDWFNLTKSKG